MKLNLRSVLMLSCSIFVINTNAQTGDPALTEVWEPIPVTITPGENGGAPCDAVVLFDGKDLSQWTGNEAGKEAKWEVKDGILTVVGGTGSIATKTAFGDCQLHLEFRTPEKVEGEGQGRGNSGVFLQGRYEVQILDCYNNRTYSNGQTAAIYKQHIPLANVCKKPGQWQTYDIIFTAPRFSDKDSSLISPAYVTVIQNGVLVQNHVEIQGPVEYIGQASYKYHKPAESIVLQDHGNPVSFRNIWIREL